MKQTHIMMKILVVFTIISVVTFLVFFSFVLLYAKIMEPRIYSKEEVVEKLSCKYEGEFTCVKKSEEEIGFEGSTIVTYDCVDQNNIKFTARLSISQGRKHGQLYDDYFGNFLESRIDSFEKLISAHENIKFSSNNIKLINKKGVSSAAEILSIYYKNIPVFKNSYEELIGVTYKEETLRTYTAETKRKIDEDKLYEYFYNDLKRGFRKKGGKK